MTTDEKQPAESTTSTSPLLPPAEDNDEEFDEVCLCRSGRDQHGRRSMLYERRTTGAIVTRTELDEARLAFMRGTPMLDFCHRMDLILVVSHCEWVPAGPLRKAARWLFTPFGWVAMIGIGVGVQWDCWRLSRMGYPRPEEVEEEEEGTASP